MRRGRESGMLPSPNPGPAHRVARLMSSCPGSVLVATGEPGLSPVSVCSNGASAYAAVVIMVRKGCSAESAGALSPTICGLLPVSLPDMVEFIYRRTTSLTTPAFSPVSHHNLGLDCGAKLMEKERETRQ